MTQLHKNHDLALAVEKRLMTPGMDLLIDLGFIEVAEWRPGMDYAWVTKAAKNPGWLYAFTRWPDVLYIGQTARELGSRLRDYVLALNPYALSRTGGTWPQTFTWHKRELILSQLRRGQRIAIYARWLMPDIYRECMENGLITYLAPPWNGVPWRGGAGYAPGVPSWRKMIERQR
jgi:hypothetical protein